MIVCTSTLLIYSDHIEIVLEDAESNNYLAYQWPMGYCIDGIRGSRVMYECDGYDSAVARIYDYYDEDCSGNVTSSIPIEAYFNLSYIERYFNVDLTSTCCTGNACQVAEKRTHFGFSCWQNISNSYSEEFIIIGGCQADIYIDNGESISYSSCLNGELVESKYDNVSDCSGTPISTTITNGQCIDGDTTFIECNQAIDTCPFNITGLPLVFMFVL